MMKGAVANILEAVGHTPIVQLQKVAKHVAAGIYVKCEYLNPAGSMKDRVAMHIIADAERRGLLRAGGTIVVRVRFEARRFTWAWRLEPPGLALRSVNRTLAGDSLERYEASPYLVFGAPGTMVEIRQRMKKARDYIVSVAKEVQLANEEQGGWAKNHSLYGAQEIARGVLSKRGKWQQVFS